MSAYLRARSRAPHQEPAPTLVQRMAARRSFDVAFAAAAERAEAERAQHADRIARVAFDSGRRAARGVLAVDDARARIDALVMAEHPTAHPLRFVLVPEVGAAIAREAFARGVKAARREANA